MPGKQEELATLLHHRLEAGVPVPKNSLYHTALCGLKKADGLWKLTVDYRGLKQAALPTGSAVWTRSQPHRKRQEAATQQLMLRMLFSALISEEGQQQLAFVWEGSHHSFSALLRDP